MATTQITGRQIKADAVNDTHIDWGTGANQVSGVDVPLADAGGYYGTDNVEAALQAVGGAAADYLLTTGARAGATSEAQDFTNGLTAGSGANYLAVSNAGVLSLHGTAVYERHVQIPAMSTGTPANQPTEVDFFTAGGLQFATTGAKYAFCQWEIPDDWDGTDIYFEVDWMPGGGAITAGDAIRWTVEYRAIAEGELINNGTSVTLDNGVGGDTTGYVQYKTKHSRMTLVYNNANQPLTVQDHIYFKVSRDTAVANDYGGTVTVLAFEIIYNSTGFPSN